MSTEIEDVVMVIIRNPKEPPYPWFLPMDGKDVSALTKIIGGLFQKTSGQAVGLPLDLDLWSGEESKIRGELPNIKVDFWRSGEVDDIIAGPIVVKAANDDGTSRSLTDSEIIKVTEWLKERML